MASRFELASDIVGLTKSAPASRRAVMTAAAAAAAGYTLAAGPVSAQAIKTDLTDIGDGEATVKVAAGDMPVYFARHSRIRRPPVVLVAMEVFGLHEYIKDVTRRIAKLGALAIAPDYYFTKGDIAKIADIAQLLPLVNAKPDSELVAELDAVVDWAGGQGADTDKAGIVGFCRGGRAVWVYCATSGKMKAGVAFYGSLSDPESQKSLWPKSALELAPDLKAPVLGLYGETDQGIPVSQVEAMNAALKAAGKPSEIKLYPGAPHGFHADYRPSYNKAAAEDAWREMHAWLKQHGCVEF